MPKRLLDDQSGNPGKTARHDRPAGADGDERHAPQSPAAYSQMCIRDRNMIETVSAGVAGQFGLRDGIEFPAVFNLCAIHVSPFRAQAARFVCQVPLYSVCSSIRLGMITRWKTQTMPSSASSQSEFEVEKSDSLFLEDAENTLLRQTLALRGGGFFFRYLCF